MTPTLLNVTQAGKYLGMSRWGFMIVAKRDRIPYIPSGGKIGKKYDIADLERWKKRMKVLP